MLTASIFMDGGSCAACNLAKITGQVFKKAMLARSVTTAGKCKNHGRSKLIAHDTLGRRWASEDVKSRW